MREALLNPGLNSGNYSKAQLSAYCRSSWRASRVKAVGRAQMLCAMTPFSLSAFRTSQHPGSPLTSSHARDSPEIRGIFLVRGRDKLEIHQYARRRLLPGRNGGTKNAFYGHAFYGAPF